MILSEFEKLVRTPADVERLNETILELAVRGRLVAQDATDEPASALLARIRAEKQRLEAAGEIRKSKPLAKVKAEEMPFALPEGWVWTRLGEISQLINGDRGKNYPSRAELVDEGIPFINAGHLNNGVVDLSEMNFITNEKFERLRSGKIEKDDLIYCLRGSLGKIALVNGVDRGAIASSLVLIRLIEKASARYLLLLLSSPYGKTLISQYDNGSAQPNLAASSVEKYSIFLPPLAEQKRIVERVESLLAATARLSESLAAAQAERETLAAAALHRLENAADPAQASAAWALIRENFAALIDTPASVAALKQTILQLAVQGKLVAQNPADEPAAALLARIRAEKQRLEAAGEIRKSKPLAKVKAEEMPFALPEGWVWVRLGDAVIELQTGPFGSTLHKSDYVSNGIPIINPVNIQDGQIHVLEEMTVDESTRDRLQRYVLGRGDIVMGRRGEMGRCAAITDREAGWLCGSGSFAIKNSVEIDAEYLVRVIRSPYARQYLAGDSVGATMNNLNHRVLANLILGLPPLAEQQRIVERVETLFALCDGLAGELSGAEEARQRWVTAVLAGVA